MRKQEFPQALFYLYSMCRPLNHLSKRVPQEFSAMSATFDGLKDQIKSIASSPVSPTPVTADGRAADPFLALNQFCTYMRICTVCQ